MQEQRRNQKERLQHESCQHQQMQEDDKVTPTSQVPQRPTTGTCPPRAVAIKEIQYLKQQLAETRTGAGS